MVLRLSAVAAKSSDHLRQWDKQDCLGFSACSLLVLEKSSSRLRYHAERSSHANHFGSMGLNFTLRILCVCRAWIFILGVGKNRVIMEGLSVSSIIQSYALPREPGAAYTINLTLRKVR